MVTAPLLISLSRNLNVRAGAQPSIPTGRSTAGFGRRSRSWSNSQADVQQGARHGSSIYTTADGS
eukprot:768658-Hanusia_phi.AAC.1